MAHGIKVRHKAPTYLPAQSGDPVPATRTGSRAGLVLYFLPPGTTPALHRRGLCLPADSYEVFRRRRRRGDRGQLRLGFDKHAAFAGENTELPFTCSAIRSGQRPKPYGVPAVLAACPPGHIRDSTARARSGTSSTHDQHRPSIR